MIATQPKTNNAPSSTATPWTRVRLIVTVLVPTLLAGLVGPGLMGQAHAQDSDGQRPGVIERGGDDEDAQDDEPQADPGEDERRRPQNQGDQPDGDPEEEGQVITPENFDPNEEYNLPPNFDPNARPQRRPQNVKVTIDFRQAELEEVVKFFAGVMNKNFIISDSLQANKTITIISPEEVTLSQAYRAFVAALEMNGLTIVPFGNFLKIVEAGKAISEPMNTYGEGERLPGEPRMVTAIVPVQNTPAEEMQDVISKFASQHASIIPYGSSLIITENAANLQRIRNLVKRLDEDEILEQVYVYEVQYAEAADIQQKLTELFEAEQGSGNQSQNNRRRRSNRNQNQNQASDDAGGGDLNVKISQIMADERTNKLIIVANPRDFDKIRQMIELLDVPTAVGGQVHVKFLEYADAEELSSTLSNLTSGQNQQRQQAQRAQRARQPQQQGAAGSEVAALLEGEVQVTSYKPNNALIVTASPKDFVALEHVVDMLDRPRRQVYVEAVIMEIGMDTDSELGMGFSAVNGQDFDGIIPDSAVESGIIDDTQGGILGQSNFNPENLTDAFSGSVAGSIGLIGPMATIPGTQISLPAFALTLRASQTDDSVNLLSAPAIMTLDNEEAEIVVADRIPFSRGLGGGGGGLGTLAGLAGNQRGQQSGLGGLGGLGALGGLGGLISPVEYEDVGITLRILPQVNESNFVRLEIDQEVSDIKSAGGQNLTPTTTKRTAKTVVLVEDQSTVVIGGLMKERDVETISKVPFLGDIPVLGFLFRNKTSISTKQNLVLMLTPYIIEDKSDVQKIYDRKMQEREELAKLFKIDKKEYDPATNYQKKTGLVDRMRSTLEEADRKARARQEAMEAFDDQGPNYRILGTGDDQTQDDEQEQRTPPARRLGDEPQPPDEQQPLPNGDAPQGEPDAEADEEPEAEPEQ